MKMIVVALLPVIAFSLHCTKDIVFRNSGLSESSKTTNAFLVCPPGFVDLKQCVSLVSTSDSLDAHVVTALGHLHMKAGSAAEKSEYEFSFSGKVHGKDLYSDPMTNEALRFYDEFDRQGELSEIFESACRPFQAVMPRVGRLLQSNQLCASAGCEYKGEIQAGKLHMKFVPLPAQIPNSL